LPESANKFETTQYFDIVITTVTYETIHNPFQNIYHDKEVIIF